MLDIEVPIDRAAAEHNTNDVARLLDLIPDRSDGPGTVVKSEKLTHQFSNKINEDLKLGLVDGFAHGRGRFSYRPTTKPLRFRVSAGS